MSDTRQRLSQAALALYQEQGYEAVTLRELAQRLGISHTLPYRYFASKEALFAQVRAECFGQLRQLLVDCDPRSEPVPARLFALGYAIVDYVKEHPAEYRLMFALQQPPLEQYPELLQARRDAFGTLLEVVQEGVRQGSVQGDALTVLHVAWVSVHGLLTLHAAGQLVHGRSLDELMQPLLETILGPQLRRPAAINDATARGTASDRPRAGTRGKAGKT